MATAERGAWQLQGVAAGSRQGHLGDSQAENNTQKAQTLHLARLPGYSPKKNHKDQPPAAVRGMSAQGVNPHVASTHHLWCLARESFGLQMGHFELLTAAERCTTGKRCLPRGTDSP